MIASIENTILEDIRANWFKALFTERPPHGTALQWLQRHPRRRSPKTADEVMAKIVFLKELGVAVYPLTEIMLDQQRAYARHVRRRRPSKWAEIKEPRRTLEMVCFLRVTRAQLTDVHFSLTDMRGAAVFRQATIQVIRLPRLALGRIH